MSKQSTSRSPASSASSERARRRPPAGPESTVSAAWAPARRRVGEPAGGLHDLRLAAGRRSRGLRARAVRGRTPAAGRARRRARSWPCARTRGRCRRARWRATARASGSSSRDQLAEQPLVRGVGVGVQQRRPPPPPGAARASCQRQLARVGGVERAAATPSGPMRSGTPKRSSAGTSGAGAARTAGRGAGRFWRPSSITSVKPAVGEQRRARRAPLEQRIGGDRHAVREALDLLRSRAGLREHQRDRLEHARGLLGGRRGDLRRVERRGPRRRAPRR